VCPNIPTVIGLYGNIIEMLNSENTKFYWSMLFRVQNDWSILIEIGLFDALLPIFKASLEVNESWTITLRTMIDQLISQLGTFFLFESSERKFINFICVKSPF
jgi:hypothetical protein